jgi:ketosteroid isomerase-like protein
MTTNLFITSQNPIRTSRRFVTTIITLFAVALCNLFMSPATAAETSEKAVLAAHEQRQAATLAGDADKVESMMTDDFTFTHPNGLVESKAQFLDALETGKLKYKTLKDQERQVRIHGDTGIVSGTVHIVVDASGTVFNVRVVFTELWVKKGDTWKMVLWHAANAL